MKNMALTTWATRFLFNPFHILLPWHTLRPLREIQLFFPGLKKWAGTVAIPPSKRASFADAPGEPPFNLAVFRPTAFQ
jgi:hypothetical protein